VSDAEECPKKYKKQHFTQEKSVKMLGGKKKCRTFAAGLEKVV